MWRCMLEYVTFPLRQSEAMETKFNGIPGIVAQS